MSIVLKIFTMLGGLAFFLYGMNVMSSGLRKMAGGTLETALKKVTSSALAGMGLGAAITIAIQSSSAMTVMLVGLVNSNIMPFDQTISVIMGSSIGTTVTNWITAMSGVQGNGILVLLKPESFSPVLAIIGISMIMMSKKSKQQDIGRILIGFSILMYGMTLMSNSVSSLKDSPSFSSILTAFQNPIFGLLIGTVFTGVIQSSAASISIIQALSATGQISFSMAFPLILGANIGTCVTALISSIGVNRDAKKVSVIHIAMKVIGAVVCMVLFYGINAVSPFSFMSESVNRISIAMTHTAFNIANTIILFPFTKQLVALANLLVKDDNSEQDYSFLDERLLKTVSIAVNEANNMTVKMAHIANSTLLDAFQLCNKYDDDLAESILKSEDDLDMYEDKLGTFLVKLSSKALSDEDGRQVHKMLHSIGDFERLGDHAVNLLHAAVQIRDKKIVFSEQGKREIDVIENAIGEILKLTTTAYEKNDLEIASRVEPLEQVIDRLIDDLKNAHIERLQNGTCSIQNGLILNDLLNNFERISDHCSNIAVALIETNVGNFDTHEYLSNIKAGDDVAFKALFAMYSQQYRF